MNIERIWLDYRARIKSFLHSKVSNPEDVEDLLQEISIKVFNGLPSIHDTSKVKPWLFQTAHRAIIDFYRMSAKGRDLAAEDLWYVQEDPETLQELERCVEPFIRALPGDVAELLLAIDIEGVSQKDYAEAHGIAYSTLKSRVKRGREDLRSLFETCCQMTMDTQGNISDYQAKSNSCKNC